MSTELFLLPRSPGVPSRKVPEVPPRLPTSNPAKTQAEMSQGSKIEFTDLPGPVAAGHLETVLLTLSGDLFVWCSVAAIAYGVGPGTENKKERRQEGRRRLNELWESNLSGETAFLVVSSLKSL